VPELRGINEWKRRTVRTAAVPDFPYRIVTGPSREKQSLSIKSRSRWEHKVRAIRGRVVCCQQISGVGRLEIKEALVTWGRVNLVIKIKLEVPINDDAFGRDGSVSRRKRLPQDSCGCCYLNPFSFSPACFGGSTGAG
jgi:hypothetical protein